MSGEALPRQYDPEIGLSIEKKPEMDAFYTFELASLVEQEKECFEKLDEDYEFLESLQEIKNIREDQIEELHGGINRVFKITLDNGESLVFKPEEGLTEKEENGKEKIRREAAAYLIDRAVGIFLTPPTTIGYVDGRIGSIQKFVENSKSYGELNKKELKFIESDEKEKLVLFDYIIRQKDRHEGNLEFNTENPSLYVMYATDNEDAFGKNEDIFSIFINNYVYGFESPDMSKSQADFLANLGKLLENEEAKNSLKQLLAKHLSEKQIKGVLKNLEDILAVKGLPIAKLNVNLLKEARR